MEISHLSSFGIPEMIVESWRKRVGETLLPVQEKAVKDFRVLDGESLLITAPTSSGKTFCGEMAAAATIFRRKKVVLLVPLKSIAEEKYRDFVDKYSPLGIRVVIATRDHHEFEQSLERGAFDLAIVVYEKFNLLMTKNIDLLGMVDLILVDEIQMLGDPSRGGDLELALLKVKASGYSPQIVAFSAVLADAETLADWLGCRLLADRFRPVELRQGVLCNGRYRYRSFNTGIEGEEQVGECTGANVEETLLATMTHLVEQGEQVLVFMRSKRICEQLAWSLAERNLWPSAERTREYLQADNSTAISEKLAATLQSGVAFHHAGLSHSQRQRLEEGFRNGEVKVLVSTTTLALGVNLPAQSVIIDCYKYSRGSHSGRLLPSPLDWSEYEGMSGRAGRLRHGDYGRSILIAANDLEEKTLWSCYLEGAPAKLESQLLAGQSLTNVILDLVASRCADGVARVRQLVADSFMGRSQERIEQSDIDSALDWLKSSKLVFEIAGRLEASPLGRTICLKGISVASGLMLASTLEEYNGCDNLSWFYAAMSLPDAEEQRLSSFRQASDFRERLCDYLRGHVDAADAVHKLAEEHYQLTDAEADALRTAFLLLDWISTLPTADVEVRHRVDIGSILQVADQVSWLLEAAAAIAGVLNKSEHLVASLQMAAGAVKRGFDLSDTVLPQLGLQAEERDLARSLFDNGIVAHGDISQYNRATLMRILGEERADRLIRRYDRINDKSGFKAKEDVQMPRLRLPTLDRGNRVVINYANTDIDVSPKSFNYLFKLVAGRLLHPGGWLDKEEIEPGFNQAKNIYRVKQELKRFGTGLERCIENNKSGHYRINLHPEQIQVDFGSMECCADQELAELSRRLRAKQPAEVN